MPIIGFGGGFGGSGASYINGVVETSADLPITVGIPALDSVYLAKAASGTWFEDRKPAGLYCRVANNGNSDDWYYLGAFPEINADGNWELYNTTDPSKELKFDVSGVSTGTTRTIKIPDKDGTMMLVDDPIKHLVYNNSGAAIPKGKVVYLFGSQGQRTTVRLADNSSDTTSARTFGITAEAIPDNSQGFVVTEGVLSGISTAGLADGTALWLGSNGDYIDTRPTQPLHGVFVGIVVKGTSVGAGSVFVKIANGQELDEIHDVLVSSPAAKQVLARNTANTLWINKSLAIDDVTNLQSSLDNKLQASETQLYITTTDSTNANPYVVPLNRRTNGYVYAYFNETSTHKIRLPLRSLAKAGDRITLGCTFVTVGKVVIIEAETYEGIGGPPSWAFREVARFQGTTLNGGYISQTYEFHFQDSFDGAGGRWQIAYGSGAFVNIGTGYNEVAVGNHKHTAVDITNSTNVGRLLLTATNEQTQRILLSTIVYVNNTASLPTTGEIQRVYVTRDRGLMFVFEPTTNAYLEIGGTTSYPAFSAMTISQITTPGEVTYGSVLLNKGTHLDSSTGRFTAPWSGVYAFTFTASAQATTAPSLTTVEFRKNSVAFSPSVKTTTTQYQVDIAPSVPAFESLSVTANIQLNAGDYISVWLDTGGIAGNALFTGNFIG